MLQKLKVMLIEDSENDSILVLRTLKNQGFDIDSKRLETKEEVSEALERDSWDLILSDYSLPGYCATTALEQLQQSGLDIPFIVISRTIGEEVAVEMMKAGAHDFFRKGHLVKLGAAIKREMREAIVRRENKRGEVLLHKRVKELSCLHRLDEIVEKESPHIESILERAAEILPDGWMYSGDAAARIIFDGTSYDAGNVDECGMIQEANLAIDGVQRGMVRVGYLRAFPKADEGPFLSEERKLLVTIAERLGYVIARIEGDIRRKQAEEALERSNRELELRNRIAETFLTQPDDKLYDEVLQVTLDALESKQGILGFIDETGGLTVPTLARSVFDQDRTKEKNLVFPMEEWGQSIWASSLQQRRLLFSNEPSILTPKGPISVVRNIAAPIVYQGGTIGLLLVANKEVDYTENDIHLMKMLVNTIAPVLHRHLLQEREAVRRKQAEERLVSKASELEHSNKELEQFAYVASHDLQEPLRMVASYTQLLAQRYEGQLDEKADKFIGYAVDGAKRMQRLISDLLTLSRIGTRGVPFAPVDTKEVVSEVLKSLELSIEKSKAELIVGDLPTVMADHSQLVQVFQNLLTNAIKFRGERSLCIEIDARRENDFWEFSVADNGIGIEPKFHERIFAMFQRLHPRDEYEGSGIGLAVVNKIVQRHGGRIRLESELGQGTRFLFTMPGIEEAVRQSDSFLERSRRNHASPR